MSAKILIVEDDPETRDFATIVLELKGYDVVIARNGREGLAQARTEHPDLIVTDLRMPELNGLEMIRQLRRQPESATVPILVITASQMDYAQQAIRAGASRALAKPFAPELLRASIKELLKKESGGETGRQSQTADDITSLERANS
jgi:DNA-binding response OmpR family regulator